MYTICIQNISQLVDIKHDIRIQIGSIAIKMYTDNAGKLLADAVALRECENAGIEGKNYLIITTAWSLRWFS